MWQTTTHGTNMLWISSSIGWRERERFFQPYQIWYLKAVEDWEFDQETNPLNIKFILSNPDRVERSPKHQICTPQSRSSKVKYWIESLLKLSQHATQIQGTVPTPFM